MLAAASSLAPVEADASTAAPHSTDPGLSVYLDEVIRTSPASTCLSVSVDGVEVFDHDGAEPKVPASTLKLVTAAAVLDRLGEDRTFTTRVTSSAPVTGGLLEGDLALVGGGDPLLSTDLNRIYRRIGDDQFPTSLDVLADRVVAAGVKLVTGRVVGDDSRYDRERTVPAWPQRYIDQEQSGPLSALTVDDGYRVFREGDDGPVTRERAVDPAAMAADVFKGLLADRGVIVAGGAEAGRLPGASTEIATIESAPLSDVVTELLETSDNQTSELLTKELGVEAGVGGSTSAGIGEISEVLDGLDLRGVVLEDGSGLALGNRLSCDQLVELLDLSGGVEGVIGRSLPIAGETGTLRGRFSDTPAKGRLRAKTGYLNEVTSLAGFVPLASGEVATFAYIANGAVVDDEVRAPQELLATVLATYERPCVSGASEPIVAPLLPYAASTGALGMFPLDAVLLATGATALEAAAAEHPIMVGRCAVADDAFGVVLSRAARAGHRPVGGLTVLAPPPREK